MKCAAFSLTDVRLVAPIDDPHALRMPLTVNGEERQRNSTGDIIYNMCDQIAYR